MSGLIPVRDAAGKPYNGACTRYFVSDQDSTALFIGDPVTISNTNAETAGNYRTVTKATLSANNLWCGVVVGVEPVSPETVNTAPSLQNKHRPASTSMYVLVADDPGLEFIVKEDADTTPIAASALGNLGIAAAGAGGNTAYGRSSVVLDSSSFASGTATGQLILLGKVNSADNDLYGVSSAAGWFKVKINEAMHLLSTPPTSV